MAKYNRKHGMYKSPIYKVWATMRNRCSRPNIPEYRNYGARGIKVCRRWQKFENFYADMGPRPPGATIERIDNDGPYSPKNCRWATRREQAQNKRNNRWLTLGKRTQTMKEWADEIGVNPAAILYRINAGWSNEAILTTPKPEQSNAKLNMQKARAIRATYPKLSMEKIAAQYAVSKKTVLNILHNRIWIER